MQTCVPRIRDGTDDCALFDVGEGALDRVDRNPLKVVERSAEGIGAMRELVRH